MPSAEIDKRYYDHAYYIAPDGKTRIEAFAVISDAMKDKDRVARARIVLSHREHVTALEPFGKGLLGTTLRYEYEVKSEKEFFQDIPNPKISKEMVNLASHILDTKAGLWRCLAFARGARPQASSFSLCDPSVQKAGNYVSAVAR